MDLAVRILLEMDLDRPQAGGTMDVESRLQLVDACSRRFQRHGRPPPDGTQIRHHHRGLTIRVRPGDPYRDHQRQVAADRRRVGQIQTPGGRQRRRLHAEHRVQAVVAGDVEESLVVGHDTGGLAPDVGALVICAKPGEEVGDSSLAAIGLG